MSLGGGIGVAGVGAEAATGGGADLSLGGGIGVAAVAEGPFEGLIISYKAVPRVAPSTPVAFSAIQFNAGFTIFVPIFVPISYPVVAAPSTPNPLAAPPIIFPPTPPGRPPPPAAPPPNFSNPAFPAIEARAAAAAPAANVNPTVATFSIVKSPNNGLNALTKSSTFNLANSSARFNAFLTFCAVFSTTAPSLFSIFASILAWAAAASAV